METAQEIFLGFLSRLRDAAARDGLSVALRLGRVARISGGRDYHLYIKVRSQEPFKWGGTKNRLDWLKDNRFKWGVVLLRGSSESGYFLPAKDVNRYIEDATWPLAADGDFKPAEGSYLRLNKPFNSFQEFWSVLRRS